MEENQSILNDIIKNEREASAGQKYLCNLVDGFIGAVLVIACYLFAPRDLMLNFLNRSPLMKFVLAFIIVFSVRLLFLSVLGKTPGMIIFRLKYLNTKLETLSTKEKLIAVVATKAAGIKQYKI